MKKTILTGYNDRIEVETDFDDIDDYLMNVPTDLIYGNVWFCAIGSKDEKWYRLDDVHFEEE